MAKFRKNHNQTKGRHGFAARGFLLFFVCSAIIVLGFLGLLKSDNSSQSYEVEYEPATSEENTLATADDSGRSFLPSSENKVISHTYYTLSYNEEREQSDWVAYRLTKSSLEVPNVKRAKRFNYDKAIKTKSATHKDYSHSGYTRGHLAPAGDMAFNDKAMKESFLMSNMSPQVRPFNNGIWKELEESVRDWAFSNGELIVVTGPVFYDSDHDYIGKQNKIAVPDAFFKVLLDNNGRDKKSIGFIIPHELSDKPLSDYAVDIDEVERVTGIDFFPDYFDSDNTEENMESSYNLKKWKISDKRYNLRVDKWNKE